jgi:hypothetical protein
MEGVPLKLKPSDRTLITDTVNDIFYRMEARLLGRFFTGPSMYFSVASESEPEHTLEGAYRYALMNMYGANASVDENEIKSLSEITENYLEAERLKRINAIVHEVAAANSHKEAVKAIQTNIDKASTYVETVISTDSRNMQAYAEKDGIIRVSAAVGDENPTVVKLGVVDDKVCEACKKLWHSPDNPYKPRPWKLSELRDGYNKSQKDPIPTISASHPRCRHVLSYIPIGYTFDSSGVIKFEGFGHDYYSEYYQIHKHETFSEDLIKSCTCIHYECE